MLNNYNENGTSKLNIMHLVYSLEIGGLERMVISIIKNTPVNANINYYVGCLDHKGVLANELEGSAPVYELKRIQSNNLKAILKLIGIIKKNNIQIIHCHNYAPLMFGIILKIILLNKIKITYTEHNQIYKTINNRRHVLLFKQLVRFADKRICVSNDLKTFFKERNISSKFEVIWNGISEPHINKERQLQILQSLPKIPNRFIIGTAVVMSEQKGLTYLIKAASLLCKKHPEFLFLLVGDGPLRKDLEQQVKEAGIQKQVVFAGYQKDAVNYVSIMDIFVLPSLWEGLPIVLLEACALSRPIIATNVGGNSEIIKDNHNGLIIESANHKLLKAKIENLFNNGEKRKEVQKNAKKTFLQFFTIEEMINTYIKLYKKVLSY